MIPEYYEEIIRSKKFDHSLQGYNQKQVDRYLQKMIVYYEKVCKEKKELENKIIEYEKQDKHLRKALVRVEETTEEVKGKAQNEALRIIKKAEKDAENIINEAIRNAERIRNNTFYEQEKLNSKIKEHNQLYEYQTKKIIGTIYNKVRTSINSLQEDLFKDLKDYIMDLESTIQTTDVDIKDNSKVKKNSIGIDKWRLKEEQLLVGYEINKDINDSNGNIIVPKNTVVTPDIIQLLIEKEVYGELFSAIGNERNEYVK